MASAILVHLAAAILIAAVLRVLLRATHQLIFSPLRDIPGPWYAAVSNFWLTTHVLRLQQCRTIHSLFERYGPVIRIGPNKVAFCDVNTMRSVYSKFDKSSYYKSLLTNNNDHAMTTLDHASHAIRRKAYAPHYIPTNITRFQPEMHDSTLELVNILDDISGKLAIDCLTLFRNLMLDVMVASSFGCRVDALGKWAMDAEDPLSRAINDFPKRGLLRSAVPSWAWNVICKIPHGRWRQMTDSDRILSEFVAARVYETRAQMIADKLSKNEKVPLLHRLLQSDSSHTQPNDKDIISEAMGHLMAGSDTTSTSLSYWFWELSRRPDIMRKLQAELDMVMPDARRIPDITILQRLPYLNAFMKEGLRIYGSGPSLLERVVPASTTKMETFDLMGYALPPGTIIGTQAWSLHRDTSVFPSPETFLPERWLDTDQVTLERMAQHSMPFGIGSRICGGQNLAQMMFKICVAVVARNFDVTAPAQTSERSMEIKDSFVCHGRDARYFSDQIHIPGYLPRLNGV